MTDVSVPPEAASRPLPRWLSPSLVLMPPALSVALVALGLAPPLAVVVVVLSLLALVAWLEGRAPFRPAWSEASPSETRDDLAYVLLAVVPDRLARVSAEAIALGLLGALVRDDTLSPGALARGLLAFLLGDLGKYAVHRLSHEAAWLWPFHAPHHQPSRVRVLNALRVHPVNVAYNVLLDTLPMALLGVGGVVAVGFASLRAALSVLQHANLDLERGRQWLVNTPSHHRTHHGVSHEDGHSNYGSALLVWDRLFGTLRVAPAPERVGIEGGPRVPSGYLGQLVHPFCGERLERTCWLARWRAFTR
ncbi:MAG: sterol desaturase family protein [Sandaracinus sp.]